MNQIHPVLLGTATADAWGGPGEFATHEKLLASPRWSAIPEHLKITDDTQMSIYTVNALPHMSKKDIMNVLGSSSARLKVKGKFAEQYLKFFVDPDNNRAPGMTVMGALREINHALTNFGPKTTIETALDNTRISQNDSKGNGTVMRSGWLGLLDLPDPIIVALAALQSQVTHGHRLATVVAPVLPLLVKYLHTNEAKLFDVWELFEQTVHSSALKEGLSWTSDASDGLTELQQVVKEARKGLEEFTKTDVTVDPNIYFGAGWVAEEALVNAVAVAQIHPDSFFEGTRRLVCSQGDSDSTAALLGNLYGAAKVDIPVDISQFEPRYQTELSETTKWLANPKYTGFFDTLRF